MPVYVDKAKNGYGRMIIDRFWSKVDKREPDECWSWKAGTNGKSGRGRFRVGEFVDYAPRVAYEISFGIKLKDKEEVLHKCDNPRCCNPGHLFKGSKVDNVKDMVTKKRNRCGIGSGNGHAKLTEKQVLEIRDHPGSNLDIAKKYGIRPNTVSNIKLKRTWGHL